MIEQSASVDEAVQAMRERDVRRQLVGQRLLFRRIDREVGDVHVADQRTLGAREVGDLAVVRPGTGEGSVAIGGAYTGIYPARGPGGWRVIGRTATALFEPEREAPALLMPGDRVEVLTPGGGGYGDPFERDPELVRRDVRRGYYSADQVLELFGVSIDGNGEIDEAETRRTRSGELKRTA